MQVMLLNMYKLKVIQYDFIQFFLRFCVYFWCSMVPSVKVNVWESRDFVGLNTLLLEEFMYFEGLAGNRLLDSTDLYAIMEAMIYVFEQEFHFHFPLDQLTIVL